MQESSTNTQDRSVQQPYANTQDRSVLAPAEAIESIPPATLERVRQVFEEFTKEAMQSAPFEDMEDNLDIMDTTDSYMVRVSNGKCKQAVNLRGCCLLMWQMHDGASNEAAS